MLGPGDYIVLTMPIAMGGVKVSHENIVESGAVSPLGSISSFVLAGGYMDYYFFLLWVSLTKHLLHPRY